MYIPCQIVELSSLESDASGGHIQTFCCPCSAASRRRRDEGAQRSSNVSKYQNQTEEDPEMVFSRHRAAVIAGHRFLSNHINVWNLQNLAPPLPQLQPPPLPPRRLSSFFPPMEPLTPRKVSGDSGKSGDQQEGGNKRRDSAGMSYSQQHQHRKSSASPQQKISPPNIVPPIPGPLEPLEISSNNHLEDPFIGGTTSALKSPLSRNNQHRHSTPGIACPYLSPVDVTATSWEWDFGNEDTLRRQSEWAHPSSGHESGATDQVNMWGDPPVVKKGLLLQQREKMWSRWKERYFILTRDYLHCFRRLKNVYRFHITLSAMGQFIYKLRLANVEEIRWETRRNGSRIALVITHEATILIRSTENSEEALHHWYTVLQECICMSKIRRQALRCFNTSSEEDSSSSRQTHSSRAFMQDYMQNGNGSNNSNSSYTVATSATSGSSQTEVMEIYRRFGSLQRLNSNNKSSVPSTGGNDNNRKMNNSTTSCGFYLSERPALAERAQTSSHLRRFPLPGIDSGDEIDDLEIHDIMEGLPKRCENPTKEMEGSSHDSSHRTEPDGGRDDDDLHVEEMVALEEEGGEDESSHVVHPVPLPRSSSRVTLRDFVRTPWRSSSAWSQPAGSCPTPTISEVSGSVRELRESQNRSRLSQFPVPARRPSIPQRPMSSFARPTSQAGLPPGVFGGRKVLPTPWMKNPTLQIGKGAAFSRSNVVLCPSKLSADVTYLRRV